MSLLLGVGCQHPHCPHPPHHTAFCPGSHPARHCQEGPTEDGPQPGTGWQRTQGQPGASREPGPRCSSHGGAPRGSGRLPPPVSSPHPTPGFSDRLPTPPLGPESPPQALLRRYQLRSTITDQQENSMNLTKENLPSAGSQGQRKSRCGPTGREGRRQGQGPQSGGRGEAGESWGFKQTPGG